MVCVCVRVCVFDREREKIARMCLHGCTSTRSVYEHVHLSVFAYRHRPRSGSLPDTSARCLPDCQGRTTQKLRSNAQKTANQPVTRHLQLHRKRKKNGALFDFWESGKPRGSEKISACSMSCFLPHATSHVWLTSSSFLYFFKIFFN